MIFEGWKAFAVMDDFRNQFADVDEEQMIKDFDEAIAAVCKEAQRQA